MPLLQRAAQTYDDRVVILGVASNDSPEAAQEFLDDFGLTYPNVFDATGKVRAELAATASDHLRVRGRRPSAGHRHGWNLGTTSCCRD